MTDLTNPPDSAEIQAQRTGRANQFRQARRARSSLFLPALLTIALGVFLLFPAFDVIPQQSSLVALGIALAVLAIGLLARFAFNGRQERGLAFVGLLILLWLACAVTFLSNFISLYVGWPIFVVALGGAMLFTVMLDKTHDRGLALPGMIFLWAGGVALVFTMQIISLSSLAGWAIFWPFALVIVALALLPRVFRAR
jgi:hypothetical protein